MEKLVTVRELFKENNIYSHFLDFSRCLRIFFFFFGKERKREKNL